MQVGVERTALEFVRQDLDDIGLRDVGNRANRVGESSQLGFQLGPIQRHRSGIHRVRIRNGLLDLVRIDELERQRRARRIKCKTRQRLASLTGKKITRTENAGGHHGRPDCWLCCQVLTNMKRRWCVCGNHDRAGSLSGNKSFFVKGVKRSVQTRLTSKLIFFRRKLSSVRAVMIWH